MAKKKITIEGNNVYVNGNLIRNREDYNAVEDAYSSISDYLIDGKIKSTSHLGAMISKVMKSVDKCDFLGSESAINSLFRISELAQNTQNYFDGKAANDLDYCNYLIDRNLFTWQRDVLKDLARRIVLLAGRRAGKSYEMASHMISHCLTGFDEVNGIRKPRQAIYIGLTLDKARFVIWQPLMDTLEKAHIKTSKIDNSSNIIFFSNGASIKLWGNNSKADREKLRGCDASMFVIDECQSQSSLLYLINSIIGPVVKGRNGIIMLAGTGPLSGGTYWEDCITDGTWSVHKATMRDNPSIPNCEDALNQVLIENNWTEDNITFRREYLGEIVHDTNRMPFAFRMYYDKVDVHIKDIYLGVDFGFKDATAFIPLLVDDHGQCYVFSETKERQMKASDIVTALKAKVDFLKGKFGVPVSNIHIVTDHNEPSIAADMYNQGLTNIELAYKQNQDYTLRLLKDALASGDILIKKGDSIDDECERTVWKWNAEREEVIYEIDDAAYHPDSLDALRYAYTQYLLNEHLISQ